MVLVNALTHMKNPLSVSRLNKILLGVTGWFGWNYQPEKDEIFAHPAYTSLGMMYGSHLMEASDISTISHDGSLIGLLALGSATQSQQRTKQYIQNINKTRLLEQ